MMLDWLVCGGGPCGTMAVGALLERAGQPGFESIGWVEAGEFETMGRLGANYGSVPANTRNDRIVAAFESLAAFEFASSQRKRLGPTLLAAPRSETARLQLSIDALRDASAAMRASGRLAYCEAGASVRELSSDGAAWTATIGESRVRARRVFVATGAKPKPVPDLMAIRLKEAGITLLDHDAVVAPERCRALAAVGPVAIVGGAHSGMLAAKNLIEAGHTVHVFDRKPEPRFAEEREGWIKFDGTGLKGDVATWTRAPPPGLHFHAVAGDLVDALLAAQVKTVAFTWGFEKVDPFPVFYDGQQLDCFTAPRAHDDRTGRLAKGLHAGGIAFPEYWTDPEGFTEPRVGFVLHFQSHLDRAFTTALAEVPPDDTVDPKASPTTVITED